MRQKLRQHIHETISSIKLSEKVDLGSFESLIVDYTEEMRSRSEVTRIKNGQSGEVQNIANLHLYGLLRGTFTVAGATYALSIMTSPSFWIIGGWVFAVLDFIKAVQTESIVPISDGEVIVLIALVLLQEDPNKSVTLDELFINTTQQLSNDRVLESLKKLEQLKCIKWTEKSLKIIDQIEFKTQE